MLFPITNKILFFLFQKWDPEIAEFAKDWGKQCIYKRPFDDPYVENLFYKRYRKRDKPKEIMMDAIGAWLKRPDVVHNRGRRGCRRSETCKYVQVSQLIETT